MACGVSSAFYLKICSNYEKSNLIDILFEHDHVLPCRYFPYVCNEFKHSIEEVYLNVDVWCYNCCITHHIYWVNSLHVKIKFRKSMTMSQFHEFMKQHLLVTCSINRVKSIIVRFFPIGYMEYRYRYFCWFLWIMGRINFHNGVVNVLTVWLKSTVEYNFLVNKSMSSKVFCMYHDLKYSCKKHPYEVLFCCGKNYGMQLILLISDAKVWDWCGKNVC